MVKNQYITKFRFRSFRDLSFHYLSDGNIGDTTNSNRILYEKVNRTLYKAKLLSQNLLYKCTSDCS